MFDFRNLKNCLKKTADSLPQIDAAEIQAQLSAWAEKVRQADVKKLIRDQLKIERLFSRENYLIPFFEDSKTMVSLVKDYATGGYENVPWKTIAAIVGGIGYVLSPFDLIPDFLPAFGFFDDASLVKLLASAVAADAEKYRQWVCENEEAFRKAKARRERVVRWVGWATLAFVFVWNFSGRYEMWSRRNPPSLKATRTDLIRQAFAFWWWALFGWMGEKVKATRSSTYLSIAKAVVRHPKEALVLAKEMFLGSYN